MLASVLALMTAQVSAAIGIRHAARFGSAFLLMTGKNISNFIDEVYRTPPEIAAKATQMLGRAAQ